MKTCFKCGATKPLTEFYKHKEMSDGYLNKCKDCTKTDVRKNRKENIEYYRQYDKVRHRNNPERKQQTLENARLWRKNNKKRMADFRKAWEIKNPEKRKAHNDLNNAVRSGKITKKPCYICGEEKVEAHHPDYKKTLEVIWLCMQHHKELHVNERENA